MGGALMADQKGGCSCGGRFVQVKLKGSKYTAPECNQCGEGPRVYKIRRYLPDMNGRGRVVDIRYDYKQERLVDPFTALATLQQIDADIIQGTFDPRRYGSRAVAQELRFSRYVETKYLPRAKARVERGELSPSSYRKKESHYRVHLLPKLGDLDLRAITQVRINELHENMPKNRTQSTVVAELRCILGEAFRLGFITTMPVFPELKASKVRSAETFLSPQEIQRVIAAVKDPMVQRVLNAMWAYALRPCEALAIQWRDVDPDAEILTIQRHLSDTRIIGGRKSHKADEDFGSMHFKFIPEFVTAIDGLNRSFVASDFVFRGRTGNHISASHMRRQWAQALKTLGMPRVDAYTIRHSRLTQLRMAGLSMADIANFISGHSDARTLGQRYARPNKMDRVDSAHKMLVGAEKGRVLGEGFFEKGTDI